MKPPPKSEEFTRFTEAMRHIAHVPKSVVQAKMSAEKRSRQRQRLREKQASGHVSGAQSR